MAAEAKTAGDLIESGNTELDHDKNLGGGRCECLLFLTENLMRIML